MKFFSTILNITRDVTGTGVEIEGLLENNLFPNAKKFTKFARRGFFPTSTISSSLKILPLASKAALPNRDIALRNLDFVMLNPSCIQGPNPIALIGEWSKFLKVGGQLYLRVETQNIMAEYMRPVTPIEHIYADYLVKQNSQCDEHIIAAKLHESPKYFPKPQNIRMMLEYMWIYRLYFIDEHCRNILLPANLAAVEKLIRENTFQKHHIFDVPSFMKLIDLANSIYEDYLVPSDIILNENEFLLVFSKYASSNWQLPAIRKKATNEFTVFNRLLKMTICMNH